jgi:short-subunit dehydrogenase
VSAGQDVCVITGAGKGLGAAMAERFRDRGYAVCCTDLDVGAAAATADRIGGGAFALEQDVREASSHRRVAEEAASRGPIAVWINNAGVLDVGEAWAMEEASARRMVEVNVLGVIHGCAAAVAAMGRRGGTIVNVASLAGLVPSPGLAVYGATKHAVIGLSTGLAGDVRRARLPIEVCCVCPDAMETDMVRDVAHREESNLQYAAGEAMLTVDATAEAVLGLLDRPRLITILPGHRAPLVHALRPFPRTTLRVLDLFDVLGRRAKRRMGR